MDKETPVLVVSSEFGNCNALRDILSREGRKAIYASTVGECEEAFAKQDAKQEIDIVFCDRRLTDGTYRDILAMTRSWKPRVRLIVTSRLADWDEYLEAVHDGAYDLIASPIQTADIARVLNQADLEDQMTGAPLAADEVRATSGEVRT